MNIPNTAALISPPVMSWITAKDEIEFQYRNDEMPDQPVAISQPPRIPITSPKIVSIGTIAMQAIMRGTIR